MGHTKETQRWSQIDLLKSIIEDRKNRAHNDAQKIYLEKIKLAQLEKQLQLETLRAQKYKSTESPSENVDSTTKWTNNLEKLLKSIHALPILIPDKPENFLFQTLERVFVVKNVLKEFKAETLVNVLGEKLHYVLYYADEEEIRFNEK